MQHITDEHYIYEHAETNVPAAHASDGEVVIFDTRDCYNRLVQREDISLEEQVGDEPDNPATGPLYVDGAEPGDVLAVDILKIDVADHGVVAMGSGPFRDRSVPERFHILPIRDGVTEFHGVHWQLRPMIGVIGTAVPGRKVATFDAFEGGGNMDSRVITEGVTVWLPVRVPGAMLAMGDIHASMGDGEVCGTGLEADGSITVRVRVRKNFELNWPVTETSDMFYVNTNANSCDDAIRVAYMEMRRLIARATGWDETEAALYMTLRGTLEANQACLVPNGGGNTFRVGTPKSAELPRLI